MPTNTDTITNFVNAWSRMDPGELASYFCEDGAYYNMPTQPVEGRANVETYIRKFLSNWTETTWDIINIAAAGENLVFCERLDRTKTTAGDVDLPCVGVFEMEDGKIKLWRDYFDMGTFVKAMS